MDGVDDDALASIKRGCSQIAETLISPCRSFWAIGLARQAVELMDTIKPLAFNIAAQMHGARRPSDRTGERGGKRAFASPRPAADGDQIQPARSKKAASGFEMMARVFCMIVAASWLKNGHLGANGRAQRKEKRKQG